MIEFNVGDRVRYLPCMHTYHMECIDDWLMRSFTCPSCMEPVDAALLGNETIWRFYFYCFAITNYARIRFYKLQWLTEC